MDFNGYLEIAGNWAMHTGLRLLLILLLTVIAIKLVQVLSTRTSRLMTKRKMDIESKKRADTLGSVIQNLLNVLVFCVASISILGQLGVEIGPILAAVGVVGLAVGFGAQSLVKDMINGFFILMEDQIRVGDVVQVAGKGGLVEKVNLKMTILRDLDGNVHFIPNGEINVVTNMTKGYSRYVFDIGVAYRENVDEVIEIIKSVDEGLRQDPDFSHDILEPMEILGLDKFDNSAVVIKARNKTRPIQQWRVAREFNRRLKMAFDQNNIEIPFPHVTLYMGQDKSGQAPAMHIQMDDNAS